MPAARGTSRALAAALAGLVMAAAHRDRRIAIVQHAVDRVRSRAGMGFLDAEEIRVILAVACLDAFAAGTTESHYIEGQVRVAFTILGCPLYAVVGKDETGWSRSGRAVVTVLTPEQIQRRCGGE